MRSHLARLSDLWPDFFIGAFVGGGAFLTLVDGSTSAGVTVGKEWGATVGAIYLSLLMFAGFGLAASVVVLKARCASHYASMTAILLVVNGFAIYSSGSTEARVALGVYLAAAMLLVNRPIFFTNARPYPPWVMGRR